MFWYHVSCKYLGEDVIFTPRTPRSMGDNEPKTRRICVAPTIHQCLGAISLSKYDTYCHVYYTEGEPVRAKEVTDAGLTEEHWFLKKTKFKRLASINVKPYVKYSNPRGGSYIGSLALQYEDICNLEQLMFGM